MAPFDALALQKLKQRTGNVLWPQPVCPCHQTSGTRCVFGVPPGLQNAMIRLRPIPLATSVCHLSLICLLSVLNLFAKYLQCVLNLFAQCL